MKAQEQRLIFVSNRLPFSVSVAESGLTTTESVGGLVTGLRAFLASVKGTGAPGDESVWIGWPGATIHADQQDELRHKAWENHRSVPVFLRQEEMEAFYLGFCNSTIWPLFHSFPAYTIYDEQQWQLYREVNETFAEIVAQTVRPGDIVWIHDYHLMLLPRLLREKIPGIRIGFFLHIPFPEYDIFRLLPGTWRTEILLGLLGSDLVGFHTYEYSQSFLRNTLRILGVDHQLGQVVTEDRVIKVETFPIGIDVRSFRETLGLASVREESARLRESLGNVRTILSVDRLDYTKGILNRLEGFESLLELHPELQEKVVLVMVVVPSRIGVPMYDLMKRQIEEFVGKVNGRFGKVGWTPVVYLYTQLPFETLVAHYRMSDIALVTPLRDGMNLVAKEYIASRPNDEGVLVLSEMAGAAKELAEAVIVNPSNRQDVASALFEALTLPVDEQRRRNVVMRKRIERYDVVRWAHDFIDQLVTVPELQDRFNTRYLTTDARRVIHRQFETATRRLVLMDFDGTLVPIMRRPEQARPSDQLMRLLERVTRLHGVTLAVVSGRERAVLDQWLGKLDIHLVAEHGIWWRQPGSDWQLAAQVKNEWKARLIPILESYADRLPGSFVEEKEFSLVWHYRTSDPEHGARLAAEAYDHLTALTANFELQVNRGHKIVEIRPLGVNKGSMALRLIDVVQPDLIIAAGDDWTDEDLFQALPEEAFSIKVGISATRARFSVGHQHEVVRLLEEFVSD